MSGSAASNMGYANFYPNSNVNSNYVNIGSTNYSGGFTNTTIPGPPNLPGLVGAKNNVDAANSKLPTFYSKGGGKNLKRKIKNITKHYKMSRKSLKKRASTLRKKIKRRLTRSKRRRSVQRGGYSQYQNNLPLTRVYSTGGYLNPANSSLATPPPYKVLYNGGNCVDNYNHYTNKGFPSPGH
jgi:hypothetical protein